MRTIEMKMGGQAAPAKCREKEKEVKKYIHS